MWGKELEALPDPDTLVQFLLSPIKQQTVIEQNLRKNGNKLQASVEGKRLGPEPHGTDISTTRSTNSRLNDNPCGAVHARGDAEMNLSDIDPDVLSMVTTGSCVLCSAYAKRYREEQQQRIRLEVDAATLTQTLTSTELSRDDVKSQLSAAQEVVKCLNEDVEKLRSQQDATHKELLQIKDERSELQLKLRMASECVQSRDTEIKDTRQLLFQRDEQLQQLNQQLQHIEDQLQLSDEQLRQRTTENEQLTAEMTQMKELLATREAQHLYEAKRRISVENPAVRKLLEQAVEQSRKQEHSQQQDQSCQTIQHQKKIIHRMTSALSSLKQKHSELKEELNKTESEKTELGERLSSQKTALEEASQQISNINLINAELQKKNAKLAEEKASGTEEFETYKKRTDERIADLQTEKEKFESARTNNQEIERNIIEMEAKYLRKSEAYNEEMRLREEAEAIVAGQKKKLQEMVEREQSNQEQMSKLRDELQTTRRQLSERDIDMERMRQDMERRVAEAFRDGDNPQKQRADRLEKKLQNMLVSRDELTYRLKNVEHELQRETDKNQDWAQQWDEKMEMIRTLEAQVKEQRSISEEKLSQVKHERDRAMQLAKQAAKKLQVLDEEYQERVSQVKAGYEVQLERLRAAKEEELKTAADRVREIESTLLEVGYEVAASRSSLTEKMRRVRVLTDQYDTSQHQQQPPTAKH